MLDELKSAKKVVGVKQLRRALNAGTVRKAFLAEDADPRPAHADDRAAPGMIRGI